MLRLVFQRLLTAIPTLLVLITISFLMMKLAPGGPFDGERALPPEVKAQIEAAYHLDESWPVQFKLYVTDLIRGDLGPSFQYPGYTVNELIAQGFPVSLTLGVLAMMLALIVGVSAGVIAALKQNSVTDYSVMTVSMTGISIPNFVIAPILILLFAVGMGWLPAGGWDAQKPSTFILPVISLALPQIAYIARLMRASMIEVLRSNYIRTARAKGLSLFSVIRRHALRPAFMPILSYLGPATASVITGSVVIEQIFSIPGLGRHFVQGALNRDYTVVMGVVIFYGVLIIVFNFLVDIAYRMLDPTLHND